jgi:head-tail adaptor
MGINAGNMRERIELQRAKITRTASGAQSQTYETYATVHAQVIAQRTAKAFNNGEAWYPTARCFRLRIPPEVKGGDRIIYRGEAYLCLPAKVFAREGYQEVDCELISD